MSVLDLEDLDAGLRRRLSEPAWADALASVDHQPLPPWAAAIGGAAAPGPDATDGGLELGPALVEALCLRETATVEIEVTAVAADRGVLALLWTDGRVGAGIVRGVDARPDDGAAGATLRPGVEVSAFAVGSLVDEVIRLVPPAPATIAADAAVVPAELTIALGTALRRGDARLIEAVCRDLGLAQVPAVVDSAVRTMDGQLTLTVRSVGRTDVSAGSWLRCSAGWVELARTRDDQIRHTPRTVDDLAGTLRFELAGRLDAALSDPEHRG
jgi:hypothetical protein